MFRKIKNVTQDAMFLVTFAYALKGLYDFGVETIEVIKERRKRANASQDQQGA